MLNNGSEQTPQQIDSNALALALGIDTGNLDPSLAQNALSFLNSQLINSADSSSLANGNPPAKRKIQRKSGKSSPNQTAVHQSNNNLEALAASVFGNKNEDIKTEQHGGELTAASFLSSILGNSLTPQQTPTSQNNYWNENVPLKTEDRSQNSDSQSAGSQCTNCHTTKTTAWRRDAEGRLVCKHFNI